MINVDKLTPDYYYKNSRDFQFLGRLYEVLYNSLLVDIDLIKELVVSDNMDTTMVDLALYTLGFEPKHDYTNVNLLKLAQIFKTVMKYKGTKFAIECCINLLLRSQNIVSNYKVEIPTIDNVGIRTENNFDEMYTLNIYLPKIVKGSILLDDLFDYILPSGYIYNIFFTDLDKLDDNTTTTTTNDNYKIKLGSNNSKLFGQLYSSQDLDITIDNDENTNRTFTTNVVNASSTDKDGTISEQES